MMSLLVKDLILIFEPVEIRSMIICVAYYLGDPVECH